MVNIWVGLLNCFCYFRFLLLWVKETDFRWTDQNTSSPCFSCSSRFFHFQTLVCLWYTFDRFLQLAPPGCQSLTWVSTILRLNWWPTFGSTWQMANVWFIWCLVLIIGCSTDSTSIDRYPIILIPFIGRHFDLLFQCYCEVFSWC